MNDITSGRHITELTNHQAKELQSALVALGYDLVIDGVVGPKTIEAFNEFKNSKQLAYEGYIGEYTVDVLLQAVEDNKEQEDKLPNQTLLTTSLPTITNINWNDFSCPVSKYFTVGEVSRFDKQRIVKDSNHKTNVINLAKELDKVREAWGSPISVTSWYRPTEVNRRVNGASNSQHLTGKGVDIYPIGKNLISFQQWLDSKWYGALGYGARRGFVHLDFRNGKGYQSGGTKGPRWNY